MVLPQKSHTHMQEKKRKKIRNEIFSNKLRKNKMKSFSYTQLLFLQNNFPYDELNFYQLNLDHVLILMIYTHHKNKVFNKHFSSRLHKNN